MKYHLYLLLLLLAACSGGSGEKSVTETPDRPPNVIVILSDDQGWGDFSFTGNTNLATPHIDRLAREGAYFDNFYVQPVCSPTRAEFLTGRYASRSGVYSTSEGGERIDLDETTIAEYFRRMGYATAAYGKWHSGMQYPYHPNGRGFDDFYGFCSGHWGSYFDPMLEHNGELVSGEGYLPDDLTDHGLSFIEEHHDEPFFLYLPFNTPHSPMQVTDSAWSRFKDREIIMPATEGYEEDLQFTRAALAMCENIDQNVGRILEKLEQLGIDEETIVIYFNDNGPNSYRWNGGMRGRKGSTDEGGVRSPLFMRWPDRIPAGTVIGENAAAVDLLPTLAALTGMETDAEKPLDGVSLVPVLEEDGSLPDRKIFNHWNGRTSVRYGRYRLDHEGNLYDLVEDRGQTTDIRASNQEVYAELVAARDEFLEEVAGELPDQDERPFPLGHPGTEWTQLPARDADATGEIERSNRWPNCSFFTHWVDIEDEIRWPVHVPVEGHFEVTLYYTCPQGSEGSLLELSFGEAALEARITEAWDPPLRGMEKDRVPREESYVKDFRPLVMGEIDLPAGQGMLTLKALEKPGKEVGDVRLLMFRRIE